MITLLDYGAGNVRSVINAIEKLGETVRVAQNSHDILAAEKLVFPGVGNFGNMIHILNQKQFKSLSGKAFTGPSVQMILHRLKNKA